LHCTQIYYPRFFPGPDYLIEVDNIPDALREDVSNNASAIFNGTHAGEIAAWFSSYLVLPRGWDLHHPVGGGGLNISNSFDAHKNQISERGYVLTDIGNSTHATNYLQIKHKSSNKVILLGGRADYIVSKAGSTYATYMDKNHILCVIEVQSKHGQSDVPSCELQMQVYLLILMNKVRPSRLLGLLVLDDGRVKAFKATWDASGQGIYEQNDYFHVSIIGDVLHALLSDAN
jgi:hypothetical protein